MNEHPRFKRSGGTPNPVDVYVGQRVKIARIEKGVSLQHLGDVLGLTFQQVQKYEKGSNRISASRLQQIGNALGRPAAWFFEGSPGNGENGIGGAFTDPLHGLALTVGGQALAAAYVACDPKMRAALLAIAEAAAEKGTR